MHRMLFGLFETDALTPGVPEANEFGRLDSEINNQPSMAALHRQYRNHCHVQLTRNRHEGTFHGIHSTEYCLKERAEVPLGRGILAVSPGRSCAVHINVSTFMDECHTLSE